ncbi:alpha/beta fold hydrolase [Cellulomonas sp. NPDC089187]|uniref:alpha/beta fold hydrolase n=1 Tax=Cellulomonas sp. NPDC089187 TaxID=3154970 RepID=UPI00342FCBDE
MPTLTRTRADLDYSLTGDGPVAITAHGLTSSREMAAAEGLFDWSALAGTHTLVEYDARGHGRSTGAPVPADYTWSALAGDLLALIDQVSPDAPVDAVGASMGSATILWAAVLRPDRFRRLVLSIPPTAWDTRAAQADSYQRDARAVEQHGIDPWVRAAAAAPGPEVLGGLDFDPQPAVPATLLPSVLRGAGASDLPDPALLARVPHPTLLLPWTTDPGHPITTATALARTLPEADLRIAADLTAIRGWGAAAADFLA